MLSDIHRSYGPAILNNAAELPMTKGMKPKRFIPVLCLALSLAQPLHAAGCYADYKAKQDNPLRLHYGVAAIKGPCSASAAAAELAPRLAAQGWTLLNILSTFDEGGLDQRKSSAGQNYLRF